MLYRMELLIAYILYYTGIYWLQRRRLDRKGATVVLVYHRVLSNSRGTGEMVGEKEFAWQMNYLASKAVPVDWKQILEATENGRRGLRVLVTFDDGYRDNFTRALPILERFNVPAVFFVVTKFVFDREHIQLDESSDEDDLFPSQSELEYAATSSVVTYGNHTDSHRLVSSISEDELDAELRSSQQRFLEKFGKSPELFAYPRGRLEDIADRHTVLGKNGITAAFTMVPGLINLEEDDRFMLRRVGVSHINNRVLFKVKSIGLITPLINLRNRLSAAFKH